VAPEDAAGLLFGVAAGARVGVERLGARFAAQLRDRHPVQDRVDAPVAAGLVAVADRLPGPSAVEAGIGALALKRAKPGVVKRRGSPTSANSSATERVESPQS
jgi:hypothetical protein